MLEFERWLCLMSKEVIALSVIHMPFRVTRNNASDYQTANPNQWRF